MYCWAVHRKGPKKDEHAAVTVGHKVYSFGGSRYGETHTFNSDQMVVHIFDTVSLRLVKFPPVTSERERPLLEVPCMCEGHTAVLIEYVIYILGGWTYTGLINLLYAFHVDSHRWVECKSSGAVPEARYGHSACVLGKVMYVYGGHTQLNGRTNDIYKLDTTTMLWSLVNTRGSPVLPSSHHSATIIGTKMFVFGAGGHKDNYNNIRVFDTETNCWQSTPCAQCLPNGRLCHSAFAYNGELYIFCGYSLNQSVNDLWKFNPEAFSWTKVEPKGKGPCSLMYKMCCCMVGDRIVVFGGFNTPDLYIYILYLHPSLKVLCKLAVIQYGLEQSRLPYNIRWELAAMTSNSVASHGVRTSCGQSVAPVYGV